MPKLVLKKKFTDSEKELAQLDERFRRDLDERVIHRMQELPWSRCDKKVYIDIKNDSFYSFDSFEVTYPTREMLDKRPTGFRVDIISGDIEFHMKVDSSRLYFTIEPPNGVDEVQKLYATVNDWARSIKVIPRCREFGGQREKQMDNINYRFIVSPIP